MRQIAALYIYENELYAIEGTGKMVREALENAARFFEMCSGELVRSDPAPSRCKARSTEGTLPAP